MFTCYVQLRRGMNEMIQCMNILNSLIRTSIETRAVGPFHLEGGTLIVSLCKSVGVVSLCAQHTRCGAFRGRWKLGFFIIHRITYNITSLHRSSIRMFDCTRLHILIRSVKCFVLEKFDNRTRRRAENDSRTTTWL